LVDDEGDLTAASPAPAPVSPTRRRQRRFAEPTHLSHVELKQRRSLFGSDVLGEEFPNRCPQLCGRGSHRFLRLGARVERNERLCRRLVNPLVLSIAIPAQFAAALSRAR
jgi:hypothetical protein